jgi:hypothetical protein
MSIHTVGDSHSYSGWSGIINHHIGPYLCYTFGKKKLNMFNIKQFGIKDGDTLIFCFGEIDCRCHIHKHITNTRSYQMIINDLVNEYFEAIKAHITTSGIRFKHVCVYNVVPPVQKWNTCENIDYPFLGTDEERKQYALYFNQRLKQKCLEYGYVFFDIYDKYTDANGFLNKELSDDNVHIKNGVYILEFIKNNIHSCK